MKLHALEKKIKDDKDQSSHLERGMSVSPEKLPLAKKVAHNKKSKQGKAMVNSMKTKKDHLQNWIRKRKLSGGLFLLDVSI